MTLGGDESTSESSERERRDYALPQGDFNVPEASLTGDARIEDHSMALEGEPSTSTSVRDDVDAGDANDENDQYKKTRLAGVDGGATATVRAPLSTDVDLERGGAGDEALSATHAGTATAELQRPTFAIDAFASTTNAERK